MALLMFQCSAVLMLIIVMPMLFVFDSLTIIIMLNFAQCPFILFVALHFPSLSLFPFLSLLIHFFRDYLIETTASQVIGDYDIGDCIKYKLNIIRVGSARHVAVNFFGGRFVFRFKLSLDVSSRFTILLTTYK